MSKINNLSSGQIASLLARVKRLEQASPLSSSSIGRGRMRFYDGSVLLIENGALQVTGTATISGTLDVTGRTNLKGQVSVTGPMDVTGTVSLRGNTNVTGELNVTGPTTLDGDTEVGGNFSIVSGGIFKAGVSKIEPSGKATFGSFIIDPTSPKLISAPGGWVISDGSDDIGLASSNSSSVMLSSARAELDYKGKGFTANASGLFLKGGLAAKTGVTANIHMDSAGQLWKVG